MPINTDLIQGLTLLAKTVASYLDVKLVVGGNRAFTDGKTITLPALSVTGKQEDRDNLVGYLFHEAAHVRYTNFSVGRGVIPAVFHIANILEDPRIEKRMWAPYPGSRAKLSAMAESLVKSGAFSAPKESDSVRELLSATLLYGMRAEVTQQTNLQPLADQARELLAAKVGESLVARILSYAKAGAAAIDTKGAVEAAQAIFNAIKEEAEEKEPEKPQEADSAHSSGAGNPGSGGQNGDGENGDGQVRSNSKQPGKNGKPDKNARAGNSTAQDLLDELESMTQQETRDLADKVDAGAALAKAMNKNSNDKSPGSGAGSGDTSINDGMHRPGSSWKRLNVEQVTQAMRLRLEAMLETDVMEDRRTSFMGTDFNKGRMIDSVLGSTRIFRRTSAKEDIQAAVGVLVDCSGSMSGSSMDTAVLATAVVGESVDWVGKHTDGKVAVAITGFDTRIYPVVEFDEDWRQARFNIGSMRAIGGTLLGPVAERMAASMLNREEEKKVMIVITDGEPADGPRFKQVRTDLARNGVDVYGILIGCSDTQHLFDKKAKISNIAELPAQLASMVMGSIL